MLWRPLHIVADKEVEKPIAIEIKPEGGSTERMAAAKACCARNVNEGAFAGVLKQATLSYTGDVDIGEPVVVKVPYSNTHAIHFHIESGAPRDVRKCAVAIVAIEAESRPLALMTGPVHSIDQKNVLPSI